MDIEDFYEQDPRRRESEEIELGHDWRVGDNEGLRYQVAWVEATGEVYCMLEPQLPLIGDGIGDLFASAPSEDSETVEILGKLDSKAQLEDVLLGWQEAMVESDSLAWVRGRLADHRPSPPDDTPPPPEQGAEDIAGA